MLFRSPEGNWDLSGTLMFMWDEEYLYVAGDIMDDIPGVLPQPPSWSADAIEIYIANYDVGNEAWDPDPVTPGSIPDTDDGYFACQLGLYFDADADTCRIYQWTPVADVIQSDLSMATGKVWPNGEGYVIEAMIAWEDIQSNADNFFDFQGGEVVPFTISLYDRDDWDEDDFQGYAFSERDYPAYTGPGRGWQTIEMREARETPYYKDATPYIKEAGMPVVVDGELGEWNYCFPVNMNQQTIPDYSRAYSWFPLDNFDLSAPLKFMYDEDYLYVGCAVRDDLPGVVPTPGDWNADAVELYIGNYDIGGMLEVPDHEGYINEGDMLDVQLSFYWDADNDTVYLKLWNPGDKLGMISSPNTFAVAQEWPAGDGYNLEIALALQDIADMVDENGERTFPFADAVWEIWPATYALYDRDEYDEDDFDGYQYVSDASAPYLGPGGGGWEGVHIYPKNVYDVLGELWETYVGVEEQPAVVTHYALSANYPNPFNPTTTIEFSLERTQHVTLSVYDVLGKHVTTIVDGVQPAGAHTVKFDGSELSGGIYFYQLQAGDYSETRRMALVK